MSQKPPDEGEVLAPVPSGSAPLTSESYWLLAPWYLKPVPVTINTSSIGHLYFTRGWALVRATGVLGSAIGELELEVKWS